MRRWCELAWFCAGVLLVTALGAGCDGGDGGSGGGGSGDFAVVEPGTGETNVEPLWPLHPGWLMQRAFEGIYDSTYAALEARTIDGRTVIPLASNQRADFEFVYVPSEPGFYKYLASDERGVWLLGQPREGLHGGALLVPAEVRVGMRWESRVGGSLRLSGEVVSRVEEDTIFGRRAVWTLRLEDHRRWRYEGPDELTSTRTTGPSFELRLAEGRGPITSQLVAPVAHDPLLDVDHVVVPLESTAPPLVAPEVALEPFGDGAAVLENLLPLAVSAYEDPDESGALIVAVQGMWLLFGQGVVGDGNGVVLGSAPGWTQVGVLRCLRIAGDTVSELPPRDPRCAPGDAVLLPTDGSAPLALPFTGFGLAVPESPCVVNRDFQSGDCIPSVHNFRGLLEDAAGQPYALSWMVEGRADHPGSLLGGVYDPYHYVDSTLDYPDGFVTWPTLLPFLQIRPHRDPMQARLRSFYWTRRLEESGEILLADVGGSAVRDTGRIAFSRLEAVPLTADEHFALPAVEVQSTVALRGRREHFLFGYEGLLRRVVLERDGLRTEPLARLIDLPGDEFLTAAFVYGDEVFALSQSNFQAADPWYPPEGGINRAILTTVGDVKLWRARLPAATATPVRPSPYLGIEARPFDLDVRVCWAPGHGPAPREGWTLAGAPPAAVLVDPRVEHCVLLVRPPIESQAVLAEPGAWAIEGTIPGAGRVAIGLDPSVWKEVHFIRDPEHPRGREIYAQRPALVGAPLPGGGSVSPWGIYGPGFMHTLDLGLELDVAGESAVDAAGHGLWVYRPRVGEHNVMLVDGDGTTVVPIEAYVAGKPLLHPNYQLAVGSVPGGGVLVGDLLVRPDGTVSDLPDPTTLRSEPLDIHPRTVLDDGTVCGEGTLGQEVYCIAPDGTERARELFIGTAGWIVTGRVAWVPLPVEQTEVPFPTFVRIDLDTLEATQHAVDGLAPGALALTWDTQGRAYVVVSSESGQHAILEVDAQGPRRLEIPELQLFIGANQLGLVVEDEVFDLIALSQDVSFMDEDYVVVPPDVVRVPRAGR